MTKQPKTHIDIDTSAYGVMSPRQAAIAKALADAANSDPEKGLRRDQYPDVAHIVVWGKLCIYVGSMGPLDVKPTVVRLSLDHFKQMQVSVAQIEEQALNVIRIGRGERPPENTRPAGQPS